MARKLDKEQKADLAAFVNQLAARAGYETTAEWARDSGYPASNLSNLRNGKGSVDGYNLLRLIRAAALKIGRDPAVLAAEADAGAASPAEIVGRLRDVETGMTALTKEIRLALQRRATGGSSPVRPKKSQAAPRARDADA